MAEPKSALDRAKQNVPEVDPRIAAAEQARAQAEERRTAISPELARKLDIEGASAWVPTVPGDILTGVVVAVIRSEITNQYGHQVYPRIVIENPAYGLVAIHVLGTVLASWAKRTRPKMGDELAFRYNGKRPSQQGQDYSDIVAVSLNATETPFLWDDTPEVEGGSGPGF